MKAITSLIKCNTTTINSQSLLQLQPSVKLFNGENIYSMTKKMKGLTVIIDNYTFDDIRIEARRGGREDAINLKNVFCQIGFHVIEIIDNTYAELINELKKIKNEKELFLHDAFILIFMSHGSANGKLLCRDYNDALNTGFITVEKIIQTFDDINCPNLCNKPKILLFGCCRGTEKDEIDNHMEIKYRNDIFLGYACREGKYAKRDPTKGSYFGQALINSLVNHCHDKELRVIFQFLKDEVIKNTSEKDLNGRISAQIPDYDDRYFKMKFYFNPRRSKGDAEDIVKEYNPLLKTFEDIKEQYDLERITLGSFGEIYILKDQSSQIFMMKSYNIENEDCAFEIADKINLLRCIQHENILDYKEVYIMKQNKEFSICIKTDYSPNSLNELKEKILKEISDNLLMKHPVAYYAGGEFIKQIHAGISFLHKHYIAHRALEPSNIIVIYNGKNKPQLKIANFDLSRIIENTTSSLTIMTKTTEFTAPEIIQDGAYGMKVDIFSFGKIIADLMGMDSYNGENHGYYCIPWKQDRFETQRNKLIVLRDWMILKDANKRPNCTELQNKLTKCFLSRKQAQCHKAIQDYFKNKTDLDEEESILYRVFY